MAVPVVAMEARRRSCACLLPTGLQDGRHTFRMAQVPAIPAGLLADTKARRQSLSLAAVGNIWEGDGPQFDLAASSRNPSTGELCRNGALLKDIQNAKDRLSCNKLHVCNTGLYVLAYCPDLANVRCRLH